MHKPVKKCTLQGADGVGLEAFVYRNDSGPSPTLGLLILHPYPLLGGSMQDPTVISLFNAAVASKRFSCVVRYNQRGVGGSQGAKSVTGGADMRDVQQLVKHITQELTNPPEKVILIGYSWGSCVAAHAVDDPAVVAYVAISFPLGSLSLSGLLARAALQPASHFKLLHQSTVPKLLVVGTRDQFTTPKALCSTACIPSTTPHNIHRTTQDAAHGSSALTTNAGLVLDGRNDASGVVNTRFGALDGSGVCAQRNGSFELWVVEGADHFWFDMWDQVAQDVISWALGACDNS